MNRLALALLMVLATSGVHAADREGAPVRPKPKPNDPEEPLAKQLSFEKAAHFLDGVSTAWTRERKCGTCHTNYPYLLVRPVLKEAPTPAQDEVRKFFEARIANWDRGEKGDKPRWDTEVPATAVSLALHDAATTGKLHPLTRQALDRMWTLQQKNGAWNWLKCDWPPLEHDDYFGAVYVALGVGLAPDGYAKTDKAKEGLAKLKDYFKNNPPPDLHHKAMLLWASQKLDGLMTADEQKKAIQELQAAQRSDGGWSLPMLGAWKRRDGSNNDRNAPSDGYATGLAVYILRQSGVPASDEGIQKGKKWLESNQRESGRWFTRSLNTDNYHFISHAGTCYAALALKACEQ
jgi:squalene-hopene/tetraprenyl-beta-curcumene cyclase